MTNEYASALLPVELGNGYEPEYYGPANMEWLDRLIAENKARKAAYVRPEPEQQPVFRLLRGGRAGYSERTPSAQPELKFVPIQRIERGGVVGVLRVAVEMETALNYLQRESDIVTLTAIEPHLRRMDKLLRQMVRVVAKARNVEKKTYSLFTEESLND